MDKPQPLLVVRPVFDQTLVTVQALIFMAVGGLFATVIGGTLLYILLMVVGLGRFIPAGFIYGALLIASIACLPPLFFEMKKRALARTGFRFFDDHVDYQYFQFYLSQRRARLRYRDIENVLQEAGTLQGQRMLTTVYLIAPSLAYNQRAFPGVKIGDVPQREDYVTRITDLVEASKRRDAQRAMVQAMQSMPAAAPVYPPVTPQG